MIHRPKVAALPERPYRANRILSVGMDLDHLKTRQALLASCGYDCLTATLEDVHEKLRSGRFDLVIISVMVSMEETRHILAQLPPGTRPLVLETLALPDELLRLVTEALG
jgi:DNA-binding response OmpR family regulator